ncbi:MAG: hypothetical protein KF740_19375 [Ramlibacter sp.]|nr:hypothetical protein [Ramlibacter sp.]
MKPAPVKDFPSAISRNKTKKRDLKINMAVAKRRAESNSKRVGGVIDHKYPEGPSVIDHGKTAEKGAILSPERRRELAALRESFVWSPGVQDWRGRWWRGLTEDERRTVCALCGVEDSAESVSRPWDTLPRSVRASLSRQCREWARLLEPMRWA